MEVRSISEFSVRTFCTYVLFPRLLQPFSLGLIVDPTQEKISAGFINAWILVFLRLKSVRSCALILKPNSVCWWEVAHLCVRARVCVCVFVRIAAELRHARYREQRIVNARPCRDR